MKIVILGSNGQLGNELIKNLKKETNLKTFTRESLDIGNLSLVEKMIKNERPNILINAAAYTAVDQAEINEEDAYRINSEAVACIAKNLQALGSYLIHYSTDYVFDGSKQTPYMETDPTLPLNIYGKSKLEGERNIINLMENFFIIRTSWVIGDHGNNFVKTIIKLAKERDSLNVIDDQYGVPTSTELLCRVTSQIISKIKSKEKNISGIYNVSPKGKTTWFNIAKKIISKGIKQEIISNSRKINLKPIKSVEYKVKALRPKNSLLNTKKIEQLLNFELPFWEDDFNKVLENILSANDINNN